MEWTDWLRALAALAATLALIGLAAVLARRFGMIQNGLSGEQCRIEVVERLMLDPRRQLALVRVDDEEHLLILSPFGDRPLSVRPAKPKQPPATPPAGTPS
jgi:flagellar protein FliO/FliZ